MSRDLSSLFYRSGRHKTETSESPFSVINMDEDQVYKNGINLNDLPSNGSESVKKVDKTDASKKYPLKRRKSSQWEFDLTSRDIKSSVQRGIYKASLQQLARDGEVEELTEMLKSVPEQQRRRILNASIDEEGVTALHLASRYNNIDVCKLLIDYGSNVNARAGGKATPLHYAARYKNKKRNIDYAERSTKHAESPVTDTNTEEQLIDKRKSWVKKTGTMLYAVSQLVAASSAAKKTSVILLLADNGAHVNYTNIDGETPLHCACIKGNIDAVKQLLQCRGISIECTDIQGMTPLHHAVTHGYTEIARALISHGALIDNVDNDLMTSLHFASSEGSVEIIRMILNHVADAEDMDFVKKLLLRPDAGKNICLHLAVDKGNKDVVEELLIWSRKCANTLQFVNTPRAQNDVPIHIAAAQGYVNIVKILNDNGARLDPRNDNLATPLLLAAQHNHFQVVEFLLESGSNAEFRDIDNLTGLLVASKNGHLETISWLIENGADVTATDRNDKTCLMLAVEEKRTHAVQKLLKYDCVLKFLDETDKFANSVLHVAAKKGYLSIMRVLLEHGARVDFKNEDESTPVHVAAMFGQHVVLRELLDYDKKMINSLDENANTALHLAAIEGHTKSVQILLEYDANVGLRNTRQWTALDCACYNGWTSTAEKLLTAQSPINPPRGSRTTPLHQACLSGHYSVVKVLLEWKADVSTRLVDGRNSLDCAIDNDNQSCVRVILEHHSWKKSLRNAYYDPLTGTTWTPMRKLITKMPVMAETVFSQCITHNNKAVDDPEFEVSLDYEFLDDMYTMLEWMQDDESCEFTIKSSNGATESKNKEASRLSLEGLTSYEAFDDHGNLSKHAKAYSSDTGLLRHNHPLMLMVNRKQEGLLQHPLVTGLLRYKWNKYGGLVYYSNLVFLMLFVSLLNGYMLSIPPPYAVDIHKSLANRRFFNEFTATHIHNYSAPTACYSLLQSGIEYRGLVRLSMFGRDCLRWDLTSTNSHLFPDAGLDENYCRNPGTQLKQPWCYTNYSDTDASLRIREECDIESCPIYVKGVNVPLGATCAFPFTYQLANFTECIPHKDGPWCAYTHNYDQDKRWGLCTEENTLCNIELHLRKPCGSPNTDRLNCEARGCCFVVNDKGQPTEWTQCVQKMDLCSDRSGFCPAFKANGYCVTNREAMEVRCAKTCGFCNETEHTIDYDYAEFLYLTSVYPEMTFDPNWYDGCYYLYPEAQVKWGSGCRIKMSWQDPLRLILLIICALNLLLHLLQAWSYQLEIVHPFYVLEVFIFVLCLLLVLDFRAFDVEYTKPMLLEADLYHPLVEDFESMSGIRQNWQWQCGVIALFLSWMDLLLYFRKIPYLGIYVVMFKDVFITFLKFFIVFFFFVISFAFTFHVLLQNEAAFTYPWPSVMKTVVMMVGEIDYAGILLRSQDVYEGKVHYEVITYAIFAVFVVIMMILLMNLLVGLAVGDIIEVKEHATLERLKLQVELALEVEFSVPDFVRKRFVRQSQAILPNHYRKGGIVRRVFLKNRNLTSKIIVDTLHKNMNAAETINETVSRLNYTVNDTRDRTLDVDVRVKELVEEVREMKSMIESSLSPKED